MDAGKWASEHVCGVRIYQFGHLEFNLAYGLLWQDLSAEACSLVFPVGATAFNIIIMYFQLDLVNMFSSCVFFKYVLIFTVPSSDM